MRVSHVVKTGVRSLPQPHFRSLIFAASSYLFYELGLNNYWALNTKLLFFASWFLFELRQIFISRGSSYPSNYPFFLCLGLVAAPSRVCRTGWLPVERDIPDNRLWPEWYPLPLSSVYLLEENSCSKLCWYRRRLSRRQQQAYGPEQSVVTLTINQPSLFTSVDISYCSNTLGLTKLACLRVEWWSAVFFLFSSRKIWKKC